MWSAQRGWEAKRLRRKAASWGRSGVDSWLTLRGYGGASSEKRTRLVNDYELTFRIDPISEDAELKLSEELDALTEGRDGQHLVTINGVGSDAMTAAQPVAAEEISALTTSLQVAFRGGYTSPPESANAGRR